MKSFRKFLSILVVACMLIGMLPMTVLAEDDKAPTIVTAGDEHANYVYCNGIPVMIKEVLETDGVTKNTYIYDEKGEKRLYDTPLKDVLYVFGGAEYATVESTKIIMNSGIIGTTASSGGYLYAGGGGDVTGCAEAIVNGGHVSNVYGCGSSGTTGSVRIEYNNTTNNLQALVCGGKGIIYGDVDIVLNTPNITTLCGGGNGTSTTYVGGNVNITINGGGTIANIYGGCVSGTVKGYVSINITGKTSITKFDPMRKTYNDKVNGGAWIDVPTGFNTSIINTKNSDKTTNTGVFIFQNGIKVFGLDVTTDGKGNYFANGMKVIVKKDPADGKTYIYDLRGKEKMLDTPVDGSTIFGGKEVDSVATSNVVMESGNVAAICGSGLNGSVSGTAFIKVGDAATVTGNVYSNSVTNSVYSGTASASVIWVGKDFDLTKIQKNDNTRIFVGSAELVDKSIPVPGEVTETVIGSVYSIFANGIPIIIQKDTDGRTYVYASDGKTKLLNNTEVNGKEIYGGSYQGGVASTDVTLKSGTINRIYGGGYQGCVAGKAKVTVIGGDITEVIYGGSYDGDVGETEIHTYGPYVAKGVNGGSRNGCVLGNTNIVLDNSVAKGLYAGTGGEGRGQGYPTSDVLGNVSLTLNGGMAESVYGGCKSGLVHGNSTININGDVMIKTALKSTGLGGVSGTSTVNKPDNFSFPKAIQESTGKRTTDVLATTDADKGKLIFRFIDIPEPSGNYIVSRPGESYFITFPNGETMLVDAGANTYTDPKSSQETIKRFLDGLNLTNKTINYVVATHYHSDHIGSTAYILNNYNVDKFYTTAFPVPQTAEYNKTLKTWMDANSTTKVQPLSRGMTFTIGEGDQAVSIEVLNPAPDATAPSTTEEYNNECIVMKMKYGVNNALLCGDLYVTGEKRLLDYYKGTDKLDADMIKVPHHGDTTSSDPEFVKAVSANIAVLPHFCDTVIVNNRYKSEVEGAQTFVVGETGILKLAYDGIHEAPEIMQENYDAVPATINLTCDTENMYVDSSTQLAANFTYSAVDQYGKALAIDSAQIITTLTDDNGNPINDAALSFADNTLTVTGKPQVAYVNVNYTCGNAKASKRITFTDVPAVATTLKVSGGSDLVYVDSGKNTEIAYTPEVLDQYGKAISGAQVAVALTDDDGNTINDAALSFADNTLTVTGKPQVSYVVVKFTYGSLDSVSKRMTFTDVPAVATTLELTGGSDSITVDSTTNTTASYTYIVRDQNGNEIKDAQVTVTLTDDNGSPINDAALSFADNTLTVTGKPQVAYVVVNYACGSLKASKRTVFTAAPTEPEKPVPTTLEVLGGSDLVYVDSAKNSEIDYTYTVRDQYGKTISDAQVTVTLTDDNGNAINDSALSFADNKLAIAGKPGVSYVVVNFTCGDLKASKRTVFSAIPLLTIAPSGVSVRYTDASFALKLTSAAYTSDIAAKIVKGELSTTMVSSLTKTGMEKGTVLSLNLNKTTGEFEVVKTVDGKSAELSSSDKGTYSAFISFPELNVQGTFTLEIKGKANNNSSSGGTTTTTSTSPSTTPTASTTPATTAKPSTTPAPTTSAEPTKAPEQTTKPADKFADLKEHWAGNAVGKLVEKGIINGKEDNKFDPDGKMTRAEFAAIIERAFKLPEGTEQAFKDVTNDAWYAKSVNAAYTAGIIGGNGDGNFAPDDEISREEMAVIAARVYKYIKGAEAQANNDVTFTDADEISDWAAEDIAIVYELGLVKGSDGTFAPKADMTRAEGATIIYNLLVKLGLLD